MKQKPKPDPELEAAKREYERKLGPLTSSIDTIVKAPALKRVSKKLRSLVQNSIRIFADEPQQRDLPVGKSKFGGMPDLPEEFEWPHFRPTPNMQFDPPSYKRDYGFLDALPLSLVAQIRLSDVAKFDTQGQLPAKGWLWFFSDRPSLYEIYGNQAFDAAAWQSPVLFHPDEKVKLIRRPRPERLPTDRPWKACKLRFESQKILPKYETTWIEMGGPNPEDAYIYMTGDEVDVFAELRKEYVGSCPHRMLGYCDNIYGYLLERGYRDARSQFFPKLPPWDTLTRKQQHAEYRAGLPILSLTSHGDMSFGRHASGAFCIRRQDLKARRFDRVWFSD